MSRFGRTRSCCRRTRRARQTRESIHFLGVCGAQLLDHFAETIARPLPGGYSWQSEQTRPREQKLAA
jgi:hypothetical protein